MNKLTIYIWRSILIAILLVLLLLIGIEFIFSFVNEIRFVGTGDYTSSKAISYILLTMPQQIAQLFPMATLVGTILGLGLLASRSELIVMQQAGMSVQNIIIAVIKLALILSIISALFSEVVAPITEKMAHNMKALSLSQGKMLRTQQGVWLKDGHEFIHIQSIQPFRLEGITRYEFNATDQLVRSSYAAYAEYSGKNWVLHNVSETQFKENYTQKSVHDTQTWYSSISTDMLDVIGVKDLTELSIVGLWQTSAYRKLNQLDTGPYILALWQKLMRPFATIVMMFLAIPFIFGPLRTATMSLRLLVGILVGFAFFTANQLFGPLMLVYQLPPLMGAALPTIIFLGVGLYLNKPRSEHPIMQKLRILIKQTP